MQILQLIPTIAYGDAVGNDAIALKKILKKMGYVSNIYAESVVEPLDSKTAYKIDKMPKVNEDDIIIYHLSTGSELNFKFAKFKCRKIAIYHNVTPPEFFEQNDEFIKGINEWGLEGVRFLSDKVDYCLADSELNKQDLIDLNYKCEIDVLPIVVSFKDYKKTPNRAIVKKYSDGYKNFIFTGRIAPNKKQEDLIAAFYYYKKYYNDKSRLILVGSYKETDLYYMRLKKYVEEIGVEDVIFSGHIKFDEILAFYKVADVFLCMSEHEGFCVPLIEAMMFEVPIIAYNSTAIPGTLGGSGFLVDDKDPIFVAKCIDKVVSDKELKENLIKNQNERLEDFKYEHIAEQFKNYINAFIDKEQV